MKNNRVSRSDKADRCTGTTLAHAHTHGLHGASCKAASETWMKNARSGHPPIIFIMKESHRQEGRDEDGGGGENERVKNKRKLTSCSGRGDLGVTESQDQDI